MHCRKVGGRSFPSLTAWVSVWCAAAACATSGQYIWVDRYKPTVDPKAEYRLTPGDVINVRVFNQDAMSAPRTRIRADGKVSLPFLNDLPAAGQTPTQFSKNVEKLLLDFMRQPVVTVSIEEMHPSQVSVVGEVAHPGVYAIEPGHGVLRVLAAAGGLNDFAHKDRIYVVRLSEGVRIRFRMDELGMPGTPAARFRLLADDAILVE